MFQSSVKRIAVKSSIFLLVVLFVCTSYFYNKYEFIRYRNRNRKTSDDKLTATNQFFKIDKKLRLIYESVDHRVDYVAYQYDRSQHTEFSSVTSKPDYDRLTILKLQLRKRNRFEFILFY